ncbi:MAG TPA: PPOX class F420-dependent oxidoreductase [Actinomycetota bacterium]|jgi:PPOX class probable F420-dependent enzyme|nr:PPOX class F420-dependent oxidoreductase [Actinomycetota bacterium]
MDEALDRETGSIQRGSPVESRAERFRQYEGPGAGRIREVDPLPVPVAELLRGRNFAHLATLMPDGSPHVAPVWVDLEDGLIRVNTVEGRVKTRNLRRDPRVALSVDDHEDPYRMASIRGEVVEVTIEGADEHIDALAGKYLGVDRYPNRRRGERRVIVKIRPDRVATMGA